MRFAFSVDSFSCFFSTFRKKIYPANAPMARDITPVITIIAILSIISLIYKGTGEGIF
jgi:hypothetical protein